ncbi:hypothetical protein HGRIS_005660 [Hohenbuehelia grisea]|uniref:lytic cellulose monooxygenase (C4-dehydrogenating) n=1 Tax=Hohenbuehelia grisea TaxID=104357 RepID=A0ABR3JYY9_9AGAR
MSDTPAEVYPVQHRVRGIYASAHVLLFLQSEMKLSALATLVAAAAQLVAGHYVMPAIIANGTSTAEWSVVRTTQNHYSNGPITNVQDPLFRCYELDMNATPGQTGTATIVAGTTVGFKAGSGQTFFHPGYFSVYLTPASPVNSASAGSGKTWFKIWEWSPTWTASGGYVFASQNTNQVTFTLPKSLKNGAYLMRVEHIALHSANTFGGAQFYISCAQVNVVGGGNSLPTTNLVSIPGVYDGHEPGILLNIYYDPSSTGYKPPGPPVWTG